MKETNLPILEMVRSKYGQLKIDVPQDRDVSFEPQIVKKAKNIYVKLKRK